jgi:hypothetical protein
MLKERQHAPASGTVCVVSNKPDTLDGMHEYFSLTGIPSSARSTLNPLAELAREIAVLLLFPDDFPAHEAANYLSVLRTRRPDLLIVLVTREPPLYTAMTATDGRPLDAVVLPRPVFGWTILDAVRARLSP